MVEFATNQTDPQEPTEALGASVIADDLREQLHHFLHFLLPLLFVLDRLSPRHAPAGTKRLSNLLRCDKWASGLIHDFLWKQAQERHKQLTDKGEDVLLLWDESVNEKSESRKVEGLSPVRSSAFVQSTTDGTFPARCSDSSRLCQRFHACVKRVPLAGTARYWHGWPAHGGCPVVL